MHIYMFIEVKKNLVLESGQNIIQKHYEKNIIKPLNINLYI